METVSFVNGRVMTPDGEADRLDFEGGFIAEGNSVSGLLHDLSGDYLVPGLVELHTDNLERHFLPRAGVSWPAGLASVMAHDVHMVGAGVTTVFDAVTAGEPGDWKKMRKELFGASLAALDAAEASGLLRAEHFLHLRCEIAGEDVIDLVSPLAEHRRLKLLSIMDHTPGQRQYRDLAYYRAYYGLDNWTEDALDARIAKLQDMRSRNAGKNLRAVLALCREYGLPLASHDDTTEDEVKESVSYGAGIAEFPTTLEAAGASKKYGLFVVMGAPNIVRGKSHSGNIPAVELARLGLLDVLSSDYMPPSLLHAVFMLPGLSGLPLHKALEIVALNPARAVGLADRGSLEPGKRADAVRVRLVDGVPVVLAVWRAGKRVL
jgi:alpha-D-ribose 1-methylphosphonate 5-triphosphate diphosphatase